DRDETYAGRGSQSGGGNGFGYPTTGHYGQCRRGDECGGCSHQYSRSSHILFGRKKQWCKLSFVPHLCKQHSEEDRCEFFHFICHSTALFVQNIYTGCWRNGEGRFMRRKWAIFALIIAILAAFGGGRYLAMAILTALLPIYALLLASIILIVFL